MNKTEFTICHDTTPDDVVDKISSSLKHFGLEIQIVDEGDGFIKYKIVSTN